MTEENKKELLDEESTFPGTALSDITKGQMKTMVEYQKEHGNPELKNFPKFSGYGHMSTTQYLELIKARKGGVIPNPETNPQWSEVMDDAIKFATTICMEEDLGKIQDALHKFIDVEDPHSKFIRKALARSILKTEMKCRVSSKIDYKKMLDDHEYSTDEIKEMINENYGAPKKFKLHPEVSFASMYVTVEGDGVK